MSIGKLALGLLVTASTTQAAVLTDFEGYTLSSGSPPNFTNGLAGQDGWTATTSTGNGSVFATTSSGEYVGGKAVRAGTSQIDGTTYIGGKLGTLLDQNTFTFDFKWSNGEVYAGGWIDAAGAGAGAFVNSEAAFMVGQVRSGTDFFGIRAAGFGSARIVSSGSGVIGDWYRMQASISGNTVTLSARNLTTATDVDLNGAAAGLSFSSTLSSGNFGGSVASYNGYVIRVTGESAIDNIRSGAIPEPASLGLIALGSLGLTRRRRR